MVGVRCADKVLFESCGQALCQTPFHTFYLQSLIESLSFAFTIIALNTWQRGYQKLIWMCVCVCVCLIVFSSAVEQEYR